MDTKKEKAFDLSKREKYNAEVDPFYTFGSVTFLCSFHPLLSVRKYFHSSDATLWSWSFFLNAISVVGERLAEFGRYLVYGTGFGFWEGGRKKQTTFAGPRDHKINANSRKGRLQKIPFVSTDTRAKNGYSKEPILTREKISKSSAAPRWAGVAHPCRCGTHDTGRQNLFRSVATPASPE